MKRNQRTYYLVVTDIGYRVLLETYSLQKAKKFMKSYTKDHKLLIGEIGIDKMSWCKIYGYWKSEEIC